MQIDGKKIFYKGRLMFHLWRMASLEYQDKYIIHPTIDEYGGSVGNGRSVM